MDERIIVEVRLIYLRLGRHCWHCMRQRLNWWLTLSIFCFRMFVVVPHGSGFCIVNETLFITTALPYQIKVMTSKL